MKPLPVLAGSGRKNINNNGRVVPVLFAQAHFALLYYGVLIGKRINRTMQLNAFGNACIKLLKSGFCPSQNRQ